MKRQVLPFFMLLTGLIFFSSCEKDSQAIQDLTIEKEEVWLKPGEEAKVKIVSGNQGYRVTSSNPAILQASVSNDQITVKAPSIQGDAEAVVYVFDAADSRAQLKVSISSYAPFTLDKQIVQLSQIQALDVVEIRGGERPYHIEAMSSPVVEAQIVGNQLHLRAKNRGKTTLTMKDKRGTSSTLEVEVGGEKQAFSFSDRYFAHTNFNAIAVVDKSIRNLKQATFEMTCRMQGYRGLQTFMGLEGRLIVRGKNDDYRDTHPIEIAGLGDRIMLESSSSFPLNEWLHLALVVDCNQSEVSKKYKLFINGKEDPLIVRRNEETHSSIDLTQSNDGNRFVVGRANGQDWRVIRGTVSDVRVWSVARTEAQIRNNMCSLNSADRQGLLAHWDFSADASTDYIQDINGGAYESNLILSDATKNGNYLPVAVDKNLFTNIQCTF